MDHTDVFNFNINHKIIDFHVNKVKISKDILDFNTGYKCELLLNDEEKKYIVNSVITEFNLNVDFSSSMKCYDVCNENINSDIEVDVHEMINDFITYKTCKLEDLVEDDIIVSGRFNIHVTVICEFKKNIVKGLGYIVSHTYLNNKSVTYISSHPVYTFADYVGFDDNMNKLEMSNFTTMMDINEILNMKEDTFYNEVAII